MFTLSPLAVPMKTVALLRSSADGVAQTVPVSGFCPSIADVAF